MYGYIYKITNILTNKSYIGKHKYSKKELDPRYLTGGILIRKSIEKHGIENFTKELIDTADTLEDLNDKEIYYINYYQTKTPLGYNLTKGGDGLVDPSPEVRLKLAYWKNKTMSNKNFKSLGSDCHKVTSICRDSARAYLSYLVLITYVCSNIR